MQPDALACSALHALCVGKFDALWSHADEATGGANDAEAEEGKKADKVKKVAKKKM